MGSIGRGDSRLAGSSRPIAMEGRFALHTGFSRKLGGLIARLLPLAGASSRGPSQHGIGRSALLHRDVAWSGGFPIRSPMRFAFWARCPCSRRTLCAPRRAALTPRSFVGMRSRYGTTTGDASGRPWAGVATRPPRSTVGLYPPRMAQGGGAAKRPAARHSGHGRATGDVATSPSGTAKRALIVFDLSPAALCDAYPALRNHPVCLHFIPHRR